MSHSEHCKKCKRIFLNSLVKEFGKVTDQWRSGWPCKIEDVLSLPSLDKETSNSLMKIYESLRNHRGFRDFVRARNFPTSDYYVDHLNCLVEIDESQHFTALRAITLQLYPRATETGFDREEWLNRCNSLNRHDNHPPDRDEQRAWYDTLRDLLPAYFGMNPTIRILAKEMVGCENKKNVTKFVKKLITRNNYFIDINMGLNRSNIVKLKRKVRKMNIDWSIVQGDHVKKACRDYGEIVPEANKSKNTYLFFDNRKYDAKFIRGFAYEIATKTKLNSSTDYSGGMETVKFFNRLGFTMEYNGKLLKPTVKDEIESRVAEISTLYAKLQNDYTDWARDYSNHNKVQKWLKENNVKKAVEKQADGLCLLDPWWNKVTLPVLKIQEKINNDNSLKLIKSIICDLNEKLSDKDLNYFWYLLYFLHPGRHELFYFGHFKDNENDHYCDYSSRLTWLLRSHRQGLKGLMNAFQRGSVRKINDPYLKGCATSFLKHLQIHPTSWKWKRPSKFDANHLKTKIKNLPYKNSLKNTQPLTPIEKECVVALSQMANRSFSKWINYSPCAINSGPRFRLRPGKKITHCFNDIVDILAKSNVTQACLRDKLHEYHLIKTF